MVMEYLCWKTAENYIRDCSRWDVAVTKVSLPFPRDWLPSPFSHAHSPTRHSLTPPPPLAFLVMRCRWAETRPHVSAGFAASSAPIISSLPWHRAQRQLTARHLTAASHAWTPDTVTAWPNQIRSLVSVYTIQSQFVCLQTGWLGSSPGVNCHPFSTTACFAYLLRVACRLVKLSSHVFVCDFFSCFIQWSWLDAFFFNVLGVQLESSTDSPTLEKCMQINWKKRVCASPDCDCTCSSLISSSLTCLPLPLLLPFCGIRCVCFCSTVPIIPTASTCLWIVDSCQDRRHTKQMQSWASPFPDLTAQTRHWPNPLLHPNTLHGHLKAHMYCKHLWTTPWATVL